MADKPRSARVGMDMLFYAIMTDEETETYANPKRIRSVKSAGVSPTVNSSTHYGDDKADEVVSSMGDVAIELGVKDLTSEEMADLLGATIDANGVLSQKSTDVAPYVAIGWRSRKANGAYRYFWYYKGKFQLSDEDYKTKEDSPEFQTPTISALFIPRDSDNKWRDRVDSDDESVPEAVTKNWFTKVYDGVPIAS